MFEKNDILRTETGGTNFLGDEFIVTYQEGSWIGIFNLPNFAKAIIVTLNLFFFCVGFIQWLLF